MTESRTEESKRNTEIQGAYAKQPNNKPIDGNKNDQAESNVPLLNFHSTKSTSLLLDRMD